MFRPVPGIVSEATQIRNICRVGLLWLDGDQHDPRHAHLLVLHQPTRAKWNRWRLELQEMAADRAAVLTTFFPNPNNEKW
ncbi:MAG: hypothetical protein L6R36_002420 [Xanthoria steineri]|nr:MAG: hypothetical protein L6R36_002420 [Xanthoria steineri]